MLIKLASVRDSASLEQAVCQAQDAGRNIFMWQASSWAENEDGRYEPVEPGDCPDLIRGGCLVRTLEIVNRKGCTPARPRNSCNVSTGSMLPSRSAAAEKPSADLDHGILTWAPDWNDDYRYAAGAERQRRWRPSRRSSPTASARMNRPSSIQENRSCLYIFVLSNDLIQRAATLEIML